MNKLSKLIASILLIGLSYTAYAQDDALVVPEADQSSDVVMTFMRKSQLLPKILELSGRVKGRNSGNNAAVIRDLPFHKLYLQLGAETGKLVHEEAARIRSSGKVIDEAALQNEMVEVDSVAKEDGFEAAMNKLREIVKKFDAPAMAEMFELHLAESYDTMEIFKSLYETEGMDFMDKSEAQLVAELSSQINETEFQDLMGQIFDSEVEEYKAFVEQNKDVLEKVSVIANNGFKMESKSEKCRTFKGKKLCVPTKSEGKIKALSEIMPYISGVKSNEAIADKKEL